MCKIIAIEGPDGAGKSSLCALVQTRISNKQIKVFKTPLSSGASLTTYNQYSTEKERFLSYLLSNAITKNIHRNLDYLILDRFTLSTIIYHKNAFESMSGFVITLLEELEIVPFATVYLDVNREILDSRLSLRHEKTNHKKKSSELLMDFEHYLSNKDHERYTGNLYRLPSENNADLEKSFSLIYSLISESL